jgi:hypothetical protein
MEDVRLIVGYAIWVVIVLLTLGFFSYFSKKRRNLGSLAFLVLFPTWVITAILHGIELKYFENSNDLFSLRGFTMLLVDTFIMLIVFGGITFTLKYLKYKKAKIGIS